MKVMCLNLKPNLYKELSIDLVVKALQIAQNDKEFKEYFQRQGIELIGIEGRGIKNDKRDGLIVAMRDIVSEKVKHVEINPTVKTQLSESFVEHMCYEEQARIYEQKTGNKASKAKNKVVHDFEILATKVKNSGLDVNTLAEEIFE